MIDYDILDDEPEEERNEIVKGPFIWPGSKIRMAKHILPLIPYRERYIEPFGGSGCILLSRLPSKIEVFNDRNNGLTDFYRVLANPELVEKLMDRLELTIFGREEFFHCRDTWETVSDPVERAARWYYMIQHSFQGLGRCFGRSMKCINGRVRKNIPSFSSLHERLAAVTIENLDFEQLIKDYDSPDSVFYLDPPYVDVYDAYTFNMDAKDHLRLLRAIFRGKGCFVLSGYPNELYDTFNWDETYEFETKSLMLGAAATESNNWVGHGGKVQSAIEKVWIKR